MGGRVRDFVTLLRPHQWVKNLLVFIPLGFGYPPERWGAHLLPAVLAFLAFCLTASSVYILNDVADRDVDRLHPVKSRRPIARGAVPVEQAVLLAAFLLVAGMSLAEAVSGRLLGVVLLYFANNLLYTFWLRNIPLLDVFSVAAGFLLRVYAGAVAVAVPVSVYLFLTVFFLALFFALGKRRHELLLLPDQASRHRKALRMYTVYYLDQLMLISATLALVVYTLYTIQHAHPGMVYTVPVAVFGIFRYYHLTHNLNRGEPSDDLLADPWILAAGAVYGGVVLWSLWRG